MPGVLHGEEEVKELAESQSTAAELGCKQGWLSSLSGRVAAHCGASEGPGLRVWVGYRRRVLRTVLFTEARQTQGPRNNQKLRTDSWIGREAGLCALLVYFVICYYYKDYNVHSL